MCVFLLIWLLLPFALLLQSSVRRRRRVRFVRMFNAPSRISKPSIDEVEGLQRNLIHIRASKKRYRLLLPCLRHSQHLSTLLLAQSSHDLVRRKMKLPLLHPTNSNSFSSQRLPSDYSFLLPRQTRTPFSCDDLPRQRRRRLDLHLLRERKSRSRRGSSCW